MLVDSFAFRANCRALAGTIVAWGASYRQLRSLRSLAGGYDCVALRARVAAFGSDGVAETGRRAGPPARRRDAARDILPAGGTHRGTTRPHAGRGAGPPTRMRDAPRDLLHFKASRMPLILVPAAEVPDASRMTVSGTASP